MLRNNPVHRLRRPFWAWLALLLAITGCDRRAVPDAERASKPAAEPTATTAPSRPSAAAPQVVRLDPPNGARDVDATRNSLAVTFDRAMDPEGWSWVIEGPESAPDLGEAVFDATAHTNTVQARLLPGKTYVLWINSPRYSYFRSVEGVPVQPLRWSFTTRAGTGGGAAPPSRIGSEGALLLPPRVVAMDPPNGATGVDPAKAILRATFDRPMEASWSWVREGTNFPEARGEAYFEPDGKTAAMPVRLQPGQTYVIWLNQGEYQFFRDRSGTPARPLRWIFSTRQAN